MKKFITEYICIILVLVLVLGGCTDKKQDGEQKNTLDKTITLQMRQMDSLNPLAVTHHSVRDAFSLCYEPLFSIGNKIDAEGVLARNIEVSDDALSAIITLKDSAMWHDGVKFTSADVIHTINLLQENPSWEYSKCVEYIETAEPIDPLSLRIRLTRPYGQIVYSLTFPIVAAHNEELDTKMVGTGAYKFSKYTPATTLALSKNDKWHGGEAMCSDVEISIIKDNVAVTTAFNKGLVSAVTDKVYDTRNSTPKQNTRTATYPSLQYEYMATNHRRSIFASQTIRSAISSAIDRSDIVKNCYMGNAMEANAPIHPAAQDLTESSILSQYNLSGANEMFFLEGYAMNEKTRLLEDKNGRTFSFELLVNEENPERIKTAELLAQQLFAAGIEVRINKLPFEKYATAIKSGSFDAYLGGTRLNNPYDYEALLSKDGQLNNYGGESDYMQLALSAVCAASSEDSLSDAVFNLEEVFLREQPVCGIAFRSDMLMTSPNVLGKLMPTVNSPYRNIYRWS